MKCLLRILIHDQGCQLDTLTMPLKRSLSLSLSLSFSLSLSLSLSFSLSPSLSLFVSLSLFLSLPLSLSFSLSISLSLFFSLSLSLSLYLFLSLSPHLPNCSCHIKTSRNTMICKRNNAKHRPKMLLFDSPGKMMHDYV